MTYEVLGFASGLLNQSHAADFMRPCRLAQMIARESGIYAWRHIGVCVPQVLGNLINCDAGFGHDSASRPAKVMWGAVIDASALDRCIKARLDRADLTPAPHSTTKTDIAAVFAVWSAAINVSLIGTVARPLWGPISLLASLIVRRTMSNRSQVSSRIAPLRPAVVSKSRMARRS